MEITICSFKGELNDLIDAGVVGFKCFMCNSGVDEFPKVEIADIEDALQALEGRNTVLAVGTKINLFN